MRVVETSVFLGRRADAHERYIGLDNGLGAICSRRQGAASNAFAHDLGKPLLRNRRFAAIDRLHFLPVDIDADDAMTAPAQRGRRHTTHIPHTENAYFHFIFHQKLYLLRFYATSLVSQTPLLEKFASRLFVKKLH